MSDDLPEVSETPVSKGGRPRKLITDAATLKQVAGLGRLQATVRECAAFFSVSPVTFEAFLKEPDVVEAFESGKGQGLLSVRRSQFRLAEKNAAMAIFLGKNYLGQTDKQDHQHTGPNGGPIQTVDLTQVSDDDLRRLDAVLGGALAATVGSVGPEGADPAGTEASGD